MNIYSTIIRRVYGKYTITRFSGNLEHAQTIDTGPSPPRERPGVEANCWGEPECRLQNLVIIIVYTNSILYTVRQ